MSLLGKQIGELVDDNFILARALQSLGVDFYENRFETLKVICKRQNIPKERIIRSFYQFDSNIRVSRREIDGFPLELVVEYLKYAHYSYIKNHLPYIAKLINRLEINSEAVADLKSVFPLFVEDFIRHIYDEEDSLFHWIQELIKLERGNFHHYPLKRLNAPDLVSELEEHQDEDEMAGIRNLISVVPKNDLLTKVITKELAAFDREILYHAAIENEILYPKAIALQTKIEQRVTSISSLN